MCDEKTRKYGDYLMALIGQKDDREDTIVGVKDGSVMASLWTPKQYEDNLHTVTSNNYILFIGSFEEAKNIGKNIDFTFQEYGMNYGWLGKRGVIFVSGHSMDDKEYEEFRGYAENNLRSFKKAATGFDEFLNGFSAGTLVGLSLAIGATGIGTPILLAVQAANKKKRDNLIREQRYTYLMMQFYYEGIQKFLEG